jgi:glutamate:Na+ symporter, ESS family
LEFSLNDVFWAGLVLAMLLLVSRMIRQRATFFRKVFLPSSIIAGALALLLGPEVMPAALSPIPQRTVAAWAAMPGILINVVFAALLMGKRLPSLRDIWHYAGPQVCFGQTVAWGQYVVGILLTMLVLTPVFGVPAAAGALIEIGFEGGHGTAAGMGEAFDAIGWSEGQDLALGLATIGLVGGVVIGTILINWAVRRGTIHPAGADSGPGVRDMEFSTAEITDDDLEELKRDREREAQPTDPLSLHLGLVAVAIAIGWLILEGLRWLELATWARGDDPVTVFTYVPLFPLAMIGGVIIQGFADRLGATHLISRRLMNRISGTALDFTIVAALGALSLQAIGQNLGPFLLLAITGVTWSVLAVIFLAPRIIPTCWFERGIGDFGQSMGVTVTGLLLMRVADPPNESGALESFGYKQLMFEPVVGGGLFTGASVALLAAFGAHVMLGVTAAVMVFWIAFGFLAFGRKARENRAAERA